MDGGTHPPLRWFDGTPAVAGETPPSSRIDLRRESMAPIRARVAVGHDPDVWVDAGWDGIVLDTDRHLAALDPGYTIFHVKEKFGRLRYSCSLDHHPDGYRVIADAELEAARRCERCGQPGEIDRQTRYIRTLCAPHRQEHVFDQHVLLRLESTDTEAR